MREGQQQQEEAAEGKWEGSGEGPVALAEGRPVSCQKRQNPVGLKHDLSATSNFPFTIFQSNSQNRQTGCVVRVFHHLQIFQL